MYFELYHSHCSNLCISSGEKILAIDADDNPVVLPNEITLSSVYHDVCNDPMNEILLYYRVFASPLEDHNIVDISRLKTPT